MDLEELQNMISIIGQKKTKCRGNLRLKVLLKLTHDYVRRSWIDGQQGNPEKLLTILRNTHMQSIKTNQESTETLIDTTEEPMEVDEFVPKTAEHSYTKKESISISVKLSEVHSLNSSDGSAHLQNTEVFKLKNKYNSHGKALSRKDLKLQKVLERLLYECDFAEADSVTDNPEIYHHKVRKIQKLLTQCKLYLITDYENQNAVQQITISKVLKTIKKLLKHYGDVLELNVSDAEFNVLCLNNRYKLKKLSKKLKKYKR